MMNEIKADTVKDITRISMLVLAKVGELATFKMYHFIFTVGYGYIW